MKSLFQHMARWMAGEPSSDSALAPVPEPGAAMVRRYLAPRGIRDERVLRAMREVDRRLFVPIHLQQRAFEDVALPLAEGQTISQPLVVAAMTQWLEVSPGQRVLEIGTGSGYQAAILANMGAEVVSIERHPRLSDFARAALEAAGLNERVRLIVGDGSLGYPAGAPYDRIIATAAFPRAEPPRALLEQLIDGGLMVAPATVGKTIWRGEPLQRLRRWRREGGEFPVEDSFGVVFVPLVSEDFAPRRPER